MSKKQYLENMDRIWPNDEATQIAKSIIESLSKLNEQELQAITYRALMRYAHLHSPSAELRSAIIRLTGSSDAVLQAYGIYVDSEGTEFPIKGQDFENLIMSNLLIHPTFGEEVKAPASKVAPVFEVVNFEALRA